MAINTSAWADAQTPANANYTEAGGVNTSSFIETNSNNSAWSRNSGIDTSVPTYDDSTLTYDEATEYYDGYDATIITADDVKFSTITDGASPANATWADAT